MHFLVLEPMFEGECIYKGQEVEQIRVLLYTSVSALYSESMTELRNATYTLDTCAPLSGYGIFDVSHDL